MMHFITSPLGGVQNIAVSMSAYLSAHLARKPYSRTSPNFWCMLPMAMALLMALYSRFCGWSRVFIPLGQWARIKHITYRRHSLEGCTSWTSDNYSVWSSLLECGSRGEVCYLWLIVSQALEIDVDSGPTLYHRTYSMSYLQRINWSPL